MQSLRRHQVNKENLRYRRAHQESSRPETNQVPFLQLLLKQEEQRDTSYEKESLSVEDLQLI